MNVHYWENFYKRINSTFVPASSGTNAVIKLKEPTDMRNPVIEATTIPVTANYFKLDAGEYTQNDAYYFVTKTERVTASLTNFYLALDPLATFKTSIKASWQYVLRANDPANFNAMLTDDHNPPTESVTVSKASTSLTYGSNIPIFDLSTYRYVLSVVGAVSTIDYALNNGIAKTYVMSGGQMALLASKLCTTNFLDDLVNEFTNPMDSVIKCTAMPVNMSGMPLHGSEPIFFGSHSSTVIANVLTGRVLISEEPLALPAILSGTQDYTTRSPFVTATIYLPFVGVCPLDVDAIGGRSLNLRTVIDCYTGDITYSIRDSVTGSIIQTFSGCCGTDVPVSSTGFSAAGVATGILTTIGGIASKNPVMAASGIMTAVQSTEIHSQTNGGYSKVIGGWQGTDVIVTAYAKAPAHSITDNAAEEGLPIEKRAFLGNYTGYVLCRNGNVDIPGCKQDREEINNFLNNGIFIE